MSRDYTDSFVLDALDWGYVTYQLDGVEHLALLGELLHVHLRHKTHPQSTSAQNRRAQSRSLSRCLTHIKMRSLLSSAIPACHRELSCASRTRGNATASRAYPTIAIDDNRIPSCWVLRGKALHVGLILADLKVKSGRAKSDMTAGCLVFVPVGSSDESFAEYRVYDRFSLNENLARGVEIKLANLINSNA